jgi:MFS superfamily sulfate permease-like transporter
LQGLNISNKASTFASGNGNSVTSRPHHHHHSPRDTLSPLLPSAFTVALLAAVESLLSAVVADGMSGDHDNSNIELVAQGVANIASPLFGGTPATGAIARTATNIRSGALTPVAGMVYALTLLAILLVAAPLARFVPLARAGSCVVRGGLQHGGAAGDRHNLSFIEG